jgi:hypothetical protein
MLELKIGQSRAGISPKPPENKYPGTTRTPTDFRPRATLKSGKVRRVYPFVATRSMLKLFENLIEMARQSSRTRNRLRRN